MTLSNNHDVRRGSERAEWGEVHRPDAFSEPHRTKPRRSPLAVAAIAPIDWDWHPNAALSTTDIALHRAELHALQQVARLGERQKQAQPRDRDSSIRREGTQTQPVERLGHFASPLSPLRDRDLTALHDFFQREDMTAIETDVNQMLLRLLPAPCWEDDAFEFLRDFL